MGYLPSLPEGEWVAGPSLGKAEGDLKHRGPGTCVHGLGEDWRYQESGEEWGEESTVTVECDQADDARIDGLVRLELNKTTLTIGLKNSQSNYLQKGNEEIKNKEKKIPSGTGDMLIPKLKTKAENKKTKVVNTEQYAKIKNGVVKNNNVNKIKV